MLYYKHPTTGEVFGYDKQEDREQFGPPELVEMTQAEIDAHINPPGSQQLRIQAQIDAIERETLMNRALREFMLEQTVRETARDYNLDLSVPGNRELVQNGLYAGNVAYRKIKDVDNQIAALRAQIGAA